MGTEDGHAFVFFEFPRQTIGDDNQQADLLPMNFQFSCVTIRQVDMVMDERQIRSSWHPGLYESAAIVSMPVQELLVRAISLHTKERDHPENLFFKRN